MFSSLWEIKNSGTKIIAYTESMSFYSAYRLKRFGLDGVIDILFSPQDHDIPAGVSVDKMRRLPEEYYELQVTELRHTPLGELKPNPGILLDIIESIGADKDRCVYVGDSIFKDVAMARDVGVHDVHAEYGESQKRPEYKLLQDVSHWTEEDVQREREIMSKKYDFLPSTTLKEVFAEIFKYFEFTEFKSTKDPAISNEERRDIIDIWKKCVDVQQHFNDLEMRIRNFAITVVGALIAGVSFTYQQSLQTELFGVVLPTGVGLVAAAAFAWGGFFLMDRFWYHILLKGAVKHAAKIEDLYRERIPGIDLGSTISESSGAVKFLCVKMNSDRRLTTFYGVGLAILIVIFCALLFAKRVPSPSIAGSSTHSSQMPAPASASKP